jgi:hypothetical protein
MPSLPAKGAICFLWLLYRAPAGRTDAIKFRFGITLATKLGSERIGYSSQQTALQVLDGVGFKSDFVHGGPPLVFASPASRF